MKSGAHLHLEDVGDVVDEGVLKVLLEGFKQDQLLSHCLQLLVTLRGKTDILGFEGIWGSCRPTPLRKQGTQTESLR